MKFICLQLLADIIALIYEGPEDLLEGFVILRKIFLFIKLADLFFKIKFKNINTLIPEAYDHLALEIV
jgi:hypothetical protein